MPRTERGRELARRRARKDKLKKLRTKYAAAKTDADKQLIFEKARKISPFIKMEPAAAT
ncbi:MAG: hypothetical protein M3552_06060 [Planctomycetota bacterium]|nr:hypothetical protein [Planctomycetaceae bacterium]MDQ3330201.1 hypothetical protein [Planctomycetota bacterium]